MTSLGLLPASESSILTPRDPSITNSDDWPEFRLNDTLVTLPGSKDPQPVSLLLASEHYPLTITGRLAPPRAWQERLWRRKDGGRKGTPIVIKDVRSFAYGAYEDGSVEIWAAGQAGWFVIQPGRAYRPIYRDMCAAVNMLFFVVDAHTEPAPTKKGQNVTQAWKEPSAEEIFDRYARYELGDEARSAEAAEAVYLHRAFLLSSMVAGKEGIAWSKTSLYRHLARKFAVDLRAIRERSAPPAQSTEKSKAAAHVRQASIDSTSTSSSRKRKRGRPPKDRPIDVTSMGSSSTASSNKKNLPQRPAAVQSETQHSKQPTSRAPAPTTRRTRNDLRSIPPRSPTPEIQESATPLQTTSSDDDDEDVPARTAGKGKSALRLKPNKPIKGPSQRDKAPAQPPDGELSRSSPIPSRRRRHEFKTTENPYRRSKRHNSRTEEDEGIDIPTSPSAHSSLSGDRDAADGDTQPGAADLADAFVAHKPDPLQESTWLCALDGCTHKVYGEPSNPVSQRLIREHYALHAYDDDARVHLVKQLQAPSLPVSHLMERVKVAAKGEGIPGSRFATSRFPDPVRTKY